jgi:predicted nucleic acid-binding protein
MGMIFDSCVSVGLSSSQVDAQAVIEAAGDQPVFTSAISIGELSFGVHA